MGNSSAHIHCLLQDKEFIADLARAIAREIHASQRQELNEIVVGPLFVDASARVAFVEGQRIPLTPQEFRLLEALARHAGMLMSRDILLRIAWERPIDSTSNRAVDIHVSRLRGKLRKAFGASEERVEIVPVHKSGYRLITSP